MVKPAFVIVNVFRPIQIIVYFLHLSPTKLYELHQSPYFLFNAMSRVI